MFDILEWLRQRRIEKIRSTGGYPEKLRAIEEKEHTAASIFGIAGLERREENTPIDFHDRRLHHTA